MPRRQAPAFQRPLPVLGGIGLLIVAGVLMRASNHDESQYVAAVALMRSGLPYRDFAYLQTPLQPLILAPLAWLPAGWVHLGVRAANGLAGFATIAILYAALRGRVSSGRLAAMLLALACTDSFLLASSLARNDALPMMLLAGTVAALLRGIDSRRAGWFALAGLCVGLAASAKISALLPGAGAGLFLLLRVRRFGLGPVLHFPLGAAIGLLPTLAMALAAPGEFGFDVFDYSLAAPDQWWTAVGQASALQPLYRLAKLVAFASFGAILPALAAAAIDRRRRDDLLLLDLMIVGGLAAAYLPVPFFTQYLVPLLPPLFARLALALDGIGARAQTRLARLAAIGCVAGLTVSFGIRFGSFEVLRNIALGQRAAVLAGGGTVATLSPERIAGAPIRLDPRFAAGPFLYRTHGDLGRLAEAKGKAVAVDRLARALDSAPPSLVIIGGESKRLPNYPNGLDGPLADWARSRGYRPADLGYGFTALVAPGGR